MVAPHGKGLLVALIMEGLFVGVTHRNLEIRMVENVEEVRLKLHSGSFIDLKRLLETDIRIEATRDRATRSRMATIRK